MTKSFDVSKFKSYIKNLIEKKPRSWIYDLKKSEWLEDIEIIAQQNKTSLQGAVYIILNDFNPKCKYGNLMKFTWFSNGFSYCGKSNECRCNKESSKQKFKETSLKRYGTEHPMQNEIIQKRSCNSTIKKYGVKYTSQIKESRIKAKETSLKRYGTEHPMQNENIKRKCLESNIKNHGGILSARHPKIKEKIKNTNLRRYGVSNYTYHLMDKEVKEILLDEEKFKNYIEDKSIQYAAKDLSVDPVTISKYVRLYQCDSLIQKSKSIYEFQIENILKELGIRFEQNTKQIIPPQELDFYLPDYNVAIEINSNYWHSELAGKKDKYYHYNKWLACQKKGIDLYSYFEDELRDKLNVIEAKIRYLTNQNTCVIGARKCTIKNIDYHQEHEFLTKYHIQGPTKARNKTIGAFYHDKLVAIFSWHLRKHYLEITRFATNLEASYPGLFSKMMKHMINELNYKGQIVSFSNNSHSNGGVYRASGFQIEKIFGPAYWYTRDYITRENRQKYMKSKIAKKFGIDVSNKTEWDLMQELGYDRIWDSGKIKWVYNFNGEDNNDKTF